MSSEQGGPVAVTVWTVAPATRSGPAALTRLSPAERARATAMPAERRDGFVLARALLRELLAARLGCLPAQVPLDATCRCGRAHGRVRLVTGDPRLDGSVHLSVTRSGPVVAVALARVPVGVDVVATAAVARAPLADVALGPREHARWNRAGGPAEPLATAWARKEAVLKAVGAGLEVDPGRLDVRSGSVRVELDDGVRFAAVTDVPTIPGAVAAVAVLAPARPRRGLLGSRQARPSPPQVTVLDGTPLAST